MLQFVSHGVGTGAERGIGGPEKRIYESLTLWDSKRIKPVLMYSSQGRLWREFNERAAKIQSPVINGYVKGIEDVMALPRILGVIRRERVDLIHSQGPLVTDVYAALAARIAKKPLVITRPVVAEDLLVSRTLKLVYHALDRFVLASAARVVAVCEYGAERLRSSLRDPSKLVVIYNGIDLERYVQQSGAGQAPKETNRFLFGMCAQLVPHKAYGDFLAAARIVCEAIPEARAMIIGDGPLRRSLEEQVVRNGLRGKVAFTGFLVDVVPALSSLDVVVLTSLREGLPLCVIEAMAIGKPVVATDIAGIPELIEDRKNGYLVPTRSPAEVAKRILALYRDYAQRRAVGAAAREKAKRRFSIHRMVSEYQELYEATSRELR